MPVCIGCTERAVWRSCSGVEVGLKKTAWLGMSSDVGGEAAVIAQGRDEHDSR
jgi:hypothetical protein